MDLLIDLFDHCFTVIISAVESAADACETAQYAVLPNAPVYDQF